MLFGENKAKEIDISIKMKNFEFLHFREPHMALHKLFNLPGFQCLHL